MFPFFDNLGFWTLTGVVGLLAYVLTRGHVRRQRATAPQGSWRSPRQRLLHWLSLLLLALPFGYVALVDGEPFWATFVVLWVQAGLMSALRLDGVRFTVRVCLLFPVALASLFFGAAATVWPSVNAASLREAPWAFLSAAAVAVALSSVMSMYSFPDGYGERSR